MGLLNKLLLISFVTFFSCDTAKNVTEESKSIIEPITSLEDKDGFSLGMIEYIRNNDCNYIIVDEKTGTRFDPINLNSKEYLAFKKEKQLIYYKFKRLRMANRCSDIQPIEILDIKKRED